jgi:hypothetical protein
MSIVLYCATDEQQHAADALAAQLGAELAAPAHR